MNLCRNTRNPARQDLSGVCCEKSQHFRILVVNLFHLYIETTSRHLAVCAAQVISPLFCLRFHRISTVNQVLSQLTMKRPALEKRVILDLLKATGSPQAFLIAGGSIARRRGSRFPGLRAFKYNRVACHLFYLSCVGREAYSLSEADSTPDPPSIKPTKACAAGLLPPRPPDSRSILA